MMQAAHSPFPSKGKVTVGSVSTALLFQSIMDLLVDELFHSEFV